VAGDLEFPAQISQNHPMTAIVFHAANLDDTDRLGITLAELVPAGTTIALGGTLGAGKTRLVQAVAAGLGVPRETVVSPTFVLCQEYHGRRTLFHLDAYRIAADDEFLELGVEEYFASPALVFIEWAERVERCLPRDRLQIEIAVAGDERRDFTISAHGTALAPVVAEIAQRLT
jgi:tRNA threonylcarbamoyladenosine biosynthesis protein TsaE